MVLRWVALCCVVTTMGSGCGLTLPLGEEDAGGSGALDADTSVDARVGTADGTTADVSPTVGDAAVVDAAVDPNDGAPPTCVGLCGDLDGDGVVTDADMIALRDALAGRGAAACPVNGDLDADLDLDATDVALLRLLIDGRITDGGCHRCTQMCGDLNGDGMRDPIDVTRLRNLTALGESTTTACEWAAANVNGDTRVDSRDADMLSDYLFAGGAPICASP
jgi:hypothetical protein